MNEIRRDREERRKASEAASKKQLPSAIQKLAKNGQFLFRKQPAMPAAPITRNGPQQQGQTQMYARQNLQRNNQLQVQRFHQQRPIQYPPQNQKTPYGIPPPPPISQIRTQVQPKPQPVQQLNRVLQSQQSLSQNGRFRSEQKSEPSKSFGPWSGQFQDRNQIQMQIKQQRMPVVPEIQKSPSDRQFQRPRA
jgi:hypothetical protein